MGDTLKRVIDSLVPEWIDPTCKCAAIDSPHRFQAQISSHKEIATGGNHGERDTMAGYLLNLTFKQPTSAATADGLFNSNTVSSASKQWFQVPSTWQPGITPNVPGPVSVAAPLSSWGPLQQAPYPLKDDYLFFCNLGDDIYIRVAPDPAWSLQSGQSLQLAIYAVFGRAATASHSGDTLASPFVIGTYPRTVLTWGNAAPTASDGSWIYYLGRPSQNQSGQGSSPALSKRLRVYSCIVSAAVEVLQGSTIVQSYTYGHDPDMGVEG